MKVPFVTAVFAEKKELGKAIIDFEILFGGNNGNKRSWPRSIRTFLSIERSNRSDDVTHLFGEKLNINTRFAKKMFFYADLRSAIKRLFHLIHLIS